MMHVIRLLLIAILSSALIPFAATAQRYDVLLRGGTIIDGTGRPPYRADVAVRDGKVLAVGRIPREAKAATTLDVTGLMVTPGFVNIHSHAESNALPTAYNMLSMGVTTEIVNADGAGPLDLTAQLTTYETGTLAVNIGGMIGFNSAWAAVVGQTDRRPTADEIIRMRDLLSRGLTDGAWGVSAGLDYKPAYFATVDEVVRVVDVARPWYTIFSNHDRLRPETGFSSKLGIAETLEIGDRAGLIPVVTHMKVQGREQGTATAVLDTMTAATKAGHYAAADAYPYLAGQTALAALLVPAWAQDGGLEAFRARLADPAQRARIVAEIDTALAARFGGPSGVYLPESQQQLEAVQKEQRAPSGGETVARILASGMPSAILRFGAEPDLVKILQHPSTSIACDCGASLNTRAHPRYFGTFPRVLGRYVREQHAMSWAEAIHKMTALPAATIGMTDRGVLRAGMWADIAVFDSATVMDHATYEQPTLPSDGIVHVLVNGQIAWRDGKPTDVKAGRALRRPAKARSGPPAGATATLALRRRRR